MKRLTIGQMARLNRISEQTLRLYDKEGLFSPLYRNQDNNYRYYDICQSAQLDMIQYMKALGMSLKEIKVQMQDWNVGRMKQIMVENRNAIDRKITELNYQKRAIERTLQSYERYEAAPADGEIVIEYIPRRMMYLVDSKVNFYDYGIEVYERMLRELKESLISHNLPQIYYCNAGTIMRRERLMKYDFYSTEVFVFVDEDFVDRELITDIPASTYLCIYCNKFGKEKEYIERLLRTIQEKHYTVTGDYICEAVAEMPMDMEERGMFLRLQIPVRFS